VLAGNAHRFACIDQAHVAVLADHDRLGEGEDAGERQVQVRQDAHRRGFEHRRGFDHMPAEAVEVAGAGTAGIDEGRDAARARQQLRLDAERRAAPVDMGVQVDQARRHDFALHVAHVLARQVVADRRDLAAGEGDVGHLVEAL
jgi:hypothetical protein